MASWTYKTPSCFKCEEVIIGKDIYTVPAKINGLKTEIKVTVCSECYRDWKLEQIGVK
jgi:hypothetical protein